MKLLSGKRSNRNVWSCWKICEEEQTLQDVINFITDRSKILNEDLKVFIEESYKMFLVRKTNLFCNLVHVRFLFSRYRDLYYIIHILSSQNFLCWFWSNKTAQIEETLTHLRICKDLMFLRVCAKPLLQSSFSCIAASRLRNKESKTPINTKFDSIWSTEVLPKFLQSGALLQRFDK